ncbi:hypothetical protein FRB99_002206 [Tulasnella sp. 403]|nr:hypothetical protein FRB99_002206 [Tulasnella sp. 403]
MGGLVSRGQRDGVVILTNTKQAFELDPLPVGEPGGFCDVFRGRDGNGATAALKRCRITPKGQTSSLIKEIRREAPRWVELNHQHVLKFLGVGKDKRGFLYLASEWMERGSLDDYIKVNPNCDRPRYLREVGEAVAYLHSMNIVHGNLKASNILISMNDQAKLADFGLQRFTPPTLKPSDDIRWESPELWEGASPSKESDVYSMGMTICEVLTGKIPFSDVQAPGSFVTMIQNGERPPREPSHSPSGQDYSTLWTIATFCWPGDASQRQPIAEISTQLTTNVPAQYLSVPGSIVPSGSTSAISLHAMLPGSSEAAPGLDGGSEMSVQMSEPVHLPDNPSLPQHSASQPHVAGITDVNPFDTPISPTRPEPIPAPPPPSDPTPAPAPAADPAPGPSHSRGPDPPPPQPPAAPEQDLPRVGRPLERRPSARAPQPGAQPQVPIIRPPAPPAEPAPPVVPASSQGPAPEVSLDDDDDAPYVIPLSFDLGPGPSRLGPSQPGPSRPGPSGGSPAESDNDSDAGSAAGSSSRARSPKSPRRSQQKKKGARWK